VRGGIVYRYSTIPVTKPVKRHRGEPGNTRDTQGTHRGHTGDTRAHNRYSTDTGTVPTGTGTVLVTVQYQVN
jgi:hypothetical protein